MRKIFKRRIITIIVLLFFSFLLILITFITLYTKRNKQSIELDFERYVSGNVDTKRKDPLFRFESEDDVMNAGKDVWMKIKSVDSNTIGFIPDFNCADMLMEPRKIADGKEEKIYIVIPEKNKRYYESITDFTKDHIPSINIPEQKQTTVINSDYCGGNEYYDQQRIRTMHRYYKTNNQNTLYTDSIALEAYRVLTLNYFVIDNGQIIYTGEMTPDEIKKNCDLLMNDYLNNNLIGVYRTLKKDDNFYQYVFYSYNVSESEESLLFVYKTIYKINQKNGYLKKTIETWVADEKQLRFFL